MPIERARADKRGDARAVSARVRATPGAHALPQARRRVCYRRTRSNACGAGCPVSFVAKACNLLGSKDTRATVRQRLTAPQGATRRSRTLASVNTTEDQHDGRYQTAGARAPRAKRPGA